MNLLDTNVLSEFMRPQPAEAVTAWLDRLDPEQVWVCAVCRAEIALGLALMPAGKRQAALHYAAVVAQRIRVGRPISTEDAQIAAIALAHNFTLATRNVCDFEGIEGLQITNPWLAGA
ncbi:type II toxin-antitoxin system VapC family toxin [Tepidimonas charontis]|uniref:Toxin FitB n=1 Tax=Tepidimonas charontis TaxID=2267262 RepID=A0A554X282_9BURK|nr:type II toxin-antitoxin system VapC family toxin [Tepidimonas charontis]TSE29876.1 Toxin FitB [Tepidimonas charontis]